MLDEVNWWWKVYYLVDYMFAYGCYKSAQGRSSLVLVCSVIWLFAYSIMRSTKLYTVLGYGAASAAVVQKKFICNIVFLIVIAVAANIVGKMKKK